MEYTIVPNGYVSNVLPKIVHHLNDLVEITDGRCALDDVLLDVLNGTCLLWLAFDETTPDKDIYGLVVTKIAHYPRMKCTHVVYCAGREMDLWLGGMVDIVKRWARDNACARIEFVGRKGWTKVLAPHGARVTHYHFVADL